MINLFGATKYDIFSDTCEQIVKDCGGEFFEGGKEVAVYGVTDWLADFALPSVRTLSDFKRLTRSHIPNYPGSPVSPIYGCTMIEYEAFEQSPWRAYSLVVDVAKREDIKFDQLFAWEVKGQHARVDYVTCFPTEVSRIQFVIDAETGESKWAKAYYSCGKLEFAPLNFEAVVRYVEHRCGKDADDFIASRIECPYLLNDSYSANQIEYSSYS